MKNMIKGGNFLNPPWIITFSHLLICSLLSVDTEFLMQKKRENPHWNTTKGRIVSNIFGGSGKYVCAARMSIDKSAFCFIV